MTKALTIVGIGCDGLDGLSGKARNALQHATAVYGSDRHFALAHIPKEKQHPWPSPLVEGIKALSQESTSRPVVLATGDPMHFGIGATLAKALSDWTITCIPVPSAFSLAASRMVWPLQECVCLSIHGREPETIISHLNDGARLLLLTEGQSSLRDVIDIISHQGFSGSTIHILENLGGHGERVRTLLASDVPPNDVADLTTFAIECKGGEDSAHPHAGVGLPDNAFVHDGMMTKQEIRAMTLSALAPQPGQHLWDVGAGSASVAIEWLRTSSRMTATAFERHPDRLAMIETNRRRLGTPRLTVVPGSAPDTFENQSVPDRIFLGGNVGDDALLNACWHALKTGGRMVANAVTLEGEQGLAAAHQRHGGRLLRIQISEAGPVGPLTAMRPRMTVTQWQAMKPHSIDREAHV